ncbi:MAG: RHS repeat-associated core domain-containing protein, partial [Mediterranea sp.]|nr:RHS repeat-associated core domain-containing protein [Mediterranea sp.]
MTNRIEDPLLNCVRYDVSLLRDTVLQIQTQGVYASGKLYVTRTTDEDGNIGLDFQDKSGRLLLTRRVNREDGQQKAYDTYYIYDDWGDQCVVLPPMASGQMRVGTYESGGSAALRDYAYLYQYDARHRVIAKKLPGCDWTFFVYDRNNRLIFSQDGNQRQRGEWSFSIPDLTGRECFSGICRNGLRPFSAPLDDTVISASWYSYFPSTSSAGAGIYKGYYIVGVSLISSTVLSVNYYDDYSFLGKNGLPKETDASACYDPSVEAEGFGKRYTSNPRGLLTGTLAAQLDGSSTPAYLYSVMYYDAKGRMVQAKSSNQLSGGRDKEYIGYNFTGQPTKRKLIHSATGKPTQTELYAYTYDHAGRPLTTTHQLNGGEVMTLADNEYDELGRLVANKRNGNDSLRTDYGYNVRSWMKSISGPLFSQTLYYNDARPDGSNDPCYNGDISAMDWQVTRTGDNKRRGYNFTYDNLSRLTVADYLEGGVLSDKFSTDYSYDEHDNILSLRRHGNTGTTTYGLVDDVTFTYHGNQLVKASDAGKEATLSMSRDFKNSANMDVEYAYDASGNMTMDTNNGIYSIAYNVLNLPEKVTFAGNGDIMNEYVYSANGRKLSVAHRNAGGTKRTNYVGNLVYENDSLDMILVDGGYVKDGQYHFYFQDHLGSNRVVADAKGNVEQANHYYPYGTPFAESYNPDKQSRKYIGKEYDTENGLDWYDFEARFMDGTRFT